MLETGINPTLVAKPEGTMRVHNTSAALLLKPILVLLGNALIEFRNRRAAGGCKPVINVGLAGIVIRHRRAHAQGVDFRKNEIPHKSDLFFTDVSPKIGRV